MRARNYAAWDIKLEQFFTLESEEERLAFLVSFAVLAPSSHNSQPWLFFISGSDTIQVKPEMRRALPCGDANHRQLFISLGCAIENIAIAADYYGYNIILRFDENSEQFKNEQVTIEVGLKKNFDQKDRTASTNDSHHLIYEISKRCTNRTRYGNTAPGEKLLEQLKQCGDEIVSVHILTDRKKMNDIADISVEAGKSAMESVAFRKELSHFIKSNVTASPLGMPSFGFGIPTLLSFFAPYMIRFINMNRITEREDFALLKEATPVMIVLTTVRDTPREWVAVGRCYERIALIASRENFSTAPLAAVIQIGDFYRKLQNILSTAERPQFFCRLGRSKNTIQHSPRMGQLAVMENI